MIWKGNLKLVATVLKESVKESMDKKIFSQ